MFVFWSHTHWRRLMWLQVKDHWLAILAASRANFCVSSLIQHKFYDFVCMCMYVLLVLLSRWHEHRPKTLWNYLWIILIRLENTWFVIYLHKMAQVNVFTKKYTQVMANPVCVVLRIFRTQKRMKKNLDERHILNCCFCSAKLTLDHC